MPDAFTLLLDWRRTEAAGRGLAKLPHDFYSTTVAYLSDLKRTYETELRENPSGRKGELARQSYQRASQTARDILESRTTKLLSAAFQASVGGGSELPNSLPEERALFDRLLEDLRRFRRDAAPFLSAASGAPPTAAPPAPSVRPPEEPRPRVATAEPAIGASTTIHLLADGRPIETKGEVIDLRKGDVLTVPPEVAGPLVDAKVAERLTTTEPSSTT